VSRAFTREEDLGLQPIPEHPPARTPMTRMGACRLREELEEARLAGDHDAASEIEQRLTAGILPVPDDPRVAALGAEVTLRDDEGRERIVRLVTPEEVGLVVGGASVGSPLGAAVAGKTVGDAVEIQTPKGIAEVVVVAITWPG
jgi:transcription elongation factor GreA